MFQLAPLNWMLILNLTLTTIIMTNCINYSNCQKPSNFINKTTQPLAQKLWKW